MHTTPGPSCVRLQFSQLKKFLFFMPLYIVNDYINCLSSVRSMSTCLECDSLEFTYKNGIPYCSSCGLEKENLNIDQEVPYSSIDQSASETRADWEYTNLSPQLRRALRNDKRRKNSKSISQKEGEILIDNYQSFIFSGKSDYSKNEQFILIKEAKLLFNKGIKMQKKKVRVTNAKPMFMPPGLKNSPLFASYAALLYAERIIYGDWNKGLQYYSSHIFNKLQPKDQSGNTLSIVEIKSLLGKSYKRLKILSPHVRKGFEPANKVKNLRKSFVDTVTLYTEKNKEKTPTKVLSLISKVEQEIDSEEYREQLEAVIPESGLDLVSAEMLYQLIKLAGDKVTRSSIKKILDRKRLSDKSKTVREIFLIIKLKKEGD